jgi:hypothetical protein
MLEINKQKMAYALLGEKVPIYETDDDGNIKYITVDGKEVPVETGEYETGYGKPVTFYASINNKLDDVLIKEFGVDQSSNYAQIVTDKGALPLVVGSPIWKKSAVGYKDIAKTIVDANTADYTVLGVADEGLTVDLFLLQKNVK